VTHSCTDGTRSTGHDLESERKRSQPLANLEIDSTRTPPLFYATLYSITSNGVQLRIDSKEYRFDSRYNHDREEASECIVETEDERGIMGISIDPFVDLDLSSSPLLLYQDVKPD
jgi:hypothetical protein